MEQRAFLPEPRDFQAFREDIINKVETLPADELCALANDLHEFARLKSQQPQSTWPSTDAGAGVVYARADQDGSRSDGAASSAAQRAETALASSLLGYAWRPWTTLFKA